MISVFLKKDRDFSARRFHPWIFSRAVDRVEGEPAPGETVLVRSSKGEPLGLGAWSGSSQIPVRFWTFDPEAEIGPAFFEQRIATALGGRAALAASGVTDAYRIVNAESDGLPGVIIDRYADWIVVQFSTNGAERWKKEIVEAIARLCPSKGVYERSDSDGRQYEQLEKRNGFVLGAPPPDRVEIHENGLTFLVDVRNGHKTGFYLDQRDNRVAIAPYAAGGEMLNVFAYTGGFGVAGQKAGAARVTHVDLSAPALALAAENTRANALDESAATFVEGNAFEVLRKFRDSRRAFDMVVLDPPKFADSKAHLMGACRGYKDVNLLALKMIRPGGYLATFSCSGLIDPDLFHKVVAEAAADARREVQVVRRLHQAPDHPEGLSFPEGLYLKGLLCRVF
jgi:23S rRNA (cytosine1962-C5)-methyltransferase